MPKPNLNDPEVNSDFARSKRLSEERKTPQGIDPVTGERAAVTYRQLVNETGGDEKAAGEIFDAVARAGGYGNVDRNQALDTRSLERSVDDLKRAIERGTDLKGKAIDTFGKTRLAQQAQHQDNLVNAVGEVLERLKKG